jgi:hypothetical protein
LVGVAFRQQFLSEFPDLDHHLRHGFRQAVPKRHRFNPPDRATTRSESRPHEKSRSDWRCGLGHDPCGSERGLDFILTRLREPVPTPNHVRGRLSLENALILFVVISAGG